MKGSAENIFANGVGELSLTFIDVHGDEQVLWRRSIQQLPVQPPASSSSNSEEKTEENNAEDNNSADAAPAEPLETVATVVVEGLNYIRPPDPLPEPEPEAEEDDEDAE